MVGELPALRSVGADDPESLRRRSRARARDEGKAPTVWRPRRFPRRAVVGEPPHHASLEVHDVDLRGTFAVRVERDRSPIR